MWQKSKYGPKFLNHLDSTHKLCRIKGLTNASGIYDQVDLSGCYNLESFPMPDDAEIDLSGTLV